MKIFEPEGIYEKIAEASVYGNLGLFIGAGFSKEVLSDKINTDVMNWEGLLREVGNSYGVSTDSIFYKNHSYPEIATYMTREIAKNRECSVNKAELLLKNRICDLTDWHPKKQTAEFFRELILELDPKWIITTNYDTVLESILGEKAISLTPNDVFVEPKGTIPIYHLHGIRHDPESIVITQEDYIPLFRPMEYRQTKLSLLFRESTTVCIGYGLGDINVQTAIDWSTSLFRLESKKKIPNSIIQFYYSKEAKREVYENQQGHMIFEINDIRSELRETQNKIQEKKREIDSICSNRKIIKEEFLEKYDYRNFEELILKPHYRKLHFVEFPWEDQALVSSMLDFLERFFGYIGKNNCEDEAYDIIFEIGTQILTIRRLSEIPVLYTTFWTRVFINLAENKKSILPEHFANDSKIFSENAQIINDNIELIR